MPWGTDNDNMENIIDPIDKKLIKRELTPDKFLRNTNVRDNSIFMVDAHNAPNTMLEIGRLREYTFRLAGGGTGKKADIDEYDTAEIPFRQLIVWDHRTEEIISAYRFICGKDVIPDENGYPHTPTSKLFCFSEEFIRDQWPVCIELGRSFVQPKFQAGNYARETLFALDNVWDGLGTLVVDYPDCQYFMGKMTLYNEYNREARKLILEFLTSHFHGDEKLIRPWHPVEGDEDIEKNVKKSFDHKESTFKEEFKILNTKIRQLNTSIPPLIKTYVSLSPTIEYFGTAPNNEFGPVEEMCILIKMSDIYESKMNRHIRSYHSRNKQ